MMASSSSITTTHEQILALLTQHGIDDFRSLHHEETPTSEDSARVRGVDLSTGGKALLLKLGSNDDDNNNNNFGLFVLSASRKLHTKAIKKEFKVKNVRFATKEELAERTSGLVPGAVPPFGPPIFTTFPLYVDTSIVENKNELIAFNAGSLTDSVIMNVEDYIKVAVPTKVFTFSKE